MVAVVCVGGGHAAAQVAATLRSRKAADSLTLISDETVVPYQRPPLSKGYLAGDLDAERLPILRQSAYDSGGVRVMLGQPATGIDRSHKRVLLHSGESVAYDALILATGGRARRLTCPGADFSGVHYIRTKGDIDGLKTPFAEARHVVLVGGGYIGLEAAAVAARAGKHVTVLEAEDRVLKRAVAPAVSAFYERLHADHGVTIRTGTMVAEITGDGSATGVTTAAGDHVPADLVLVGIGMEPNSDLAASAGLTVTPQGIQVDDRCRTSDPAIFACGDVTWHHSAFYDRWMRLESVQNAVDQARVAALGALGEDARYDALPWFWSDQFGLKLQIAGLGEGADQLVVRGDPDSRSVAFFYLKEGRLIAADCVARAAEFMMAKRLISAGIPVDAEALTDDDRPFKDIATEMLKGAAA
ncbi:NAD(P)/FAD-dependent oxidoreductase [Yunchengibacter salinarum]|uniref:NAD(P)/FAD-dependent oxidoreductase n=1 Tax=Yunchengibacter salinarum TaxID=3133399 RepID=UPI0035B62037